MKPSAIFDALVFVLWMALSGFSAYDSPWILWWLLNSPISLAVEFRDGHASIASLMAVSVVNAAIYCLVFTYLRRVLTKLHQPKTGGPRFAVLCGAAEVLFLFQSGTIFTGMFVYAATLSPNAGGGEAGYVLYVIFGGFFMIIWFLLGLSTFAGVCASFWLRWPRWFTALTALVVAVMTAMAISDGLF